MITLRSFFSSFSSFPLLRCQLFGLQHSDGDVLGEEQWEWLERQLVLSAESANVTFLVSSIQITTSNPMVESWMHFPTSRSRLVEMVERIAPPNLFYLSGDVHFGEMLNAGGGGDGDEDNDDVIEITSSGMTHSCLDAAWWGRLCPYIHLFFGSRRTTPVKNYGLIDVDWREKRMKVQIMEAVTGVVMDVHERMLLEREDQAKDARHSQLRMSMEERGEERKERRIMWRQCLLTMFSLVAIRCFDIPVYMFVLMYSWASWYFGYLDYVRTFLGLMVFLFLRCLKIFYNIDIFDIQAALDRLN